MQADHESREAVADIIHCRIGIASLQTRIKEDIQAMAETLGVKAAYLQQIIALVEMERAKGEILSGERDIIETAEGLVAVAGERKKSPATVRKRALPTPPCAS